MIQYRYHDNHLRLKIKSYPKSANRNPADDLIGSLRYNR
jgi:hypothetical protein